MWFIQPWHCHAQTAKNIFWVLPREERSWENTKLFFLSLRVTALNKSHSFINHARNLPSSLDSETVLFDLPSLHIIRSLTLLNKYISPMSWHPEWFKVFGHQILILWCRYHMSESRALLSYSFWLGFCPSSSSAWDLHCRSIMYFKSLNKCVEKRLKHHKCLQ